MRKLVAVLLVLAAAGARAQQFTGPAKWADSARVLIDGAELRGVPANLDSALVLLDRALSVTPADYLLLHYKGYAMYQLANAGMGSPSKDLVKLRLEQADSLLAASAAQRPIAETFSIRSSIAGHLVGLDPAAPLSRKMMAGEMQARAQELGPSNPRVALMRGLSALYGPPEHTGGIKEADKQLQRAHDLFATDAPPRPLPSWGRAQACAYLALVRHQLGKDDEARAFAREALTYAPDYRYVRSEILPLIGDKP